MPPVTLGPLVPADEYVHHQITDTLATVGQSDRSWTEKIWAVAAARDGSLSIGFGLGKYANRGVADGVAGSIFLRIRAMLLAAGLDEPWLRGVTPGQRRIAELFEP